MVNGLHENHRKDRHLNPATLVNFLRPSNPLLSATNTHSKPGKAAGDETFVKKMKRIIKRAVQLDKVWEQDESLQDAEILVIILHAL